MNVIEASGLGKRYGSTRALRDCTLAVPGGHVTALRRSLSGWLAAADGAGLDENGIVALFTSALRDFYERRGGSGDGRGAAGGEAKGVA